MSLEKQISARDVLDKIAENAGVSIAVVDSDGSEIFVANNNSICATLNPERQFSLECSKYCGRAYKMAADNGGTFEFVCHASLSCSAQSMIENDETVAVIVGRSFKSADNYRAATERAISGDWREYDPSKLFSNTLLSGSNATSEKIFENISVAAEAAGAKTPPKAVEQAEKIVHIAEKIGRKTAVEPSAHPAAPEGIDLSAWRALFNSLLEHDYESACEAILALFVKQYGFESIAWLERSSDRLVAVAGYGSLKGRKLRLGIPANDDRLVTAVLNEMPLELAERSTPDDDPERTMLLFPITIGSGVIGAMAVLDPVPSDKIRHQIVRLCNSVATQFEILRLRSEVAQGSRLSAAVRNFSDRVKQADTGDFWIHLTQIASELMQAERGSLLVMDQETGDLEIKAVVGASWDIMTDKLPGGRVSRIVLERGEAVVVADAIRSGLPPAPPDRNYKTPSFLSAPVILGGRSIAVINFTDKADGFPFDTDDLRLFEEISPQLAVAIDRAVLKERAGEFEQLSVTDPLTGLLNRRYLDERLNEEVKRSNRHGYPMSYVMLDVDHFKSYNDGHGHPAGDVALKIVAGVVRDTLREADVAARVGGEEFGILLPQTRNDEAAMIAERLRANVETTAFPCRPVTVSIGVASCSSELCTTEGLVNAADKALYAAKNSGRNKIMIHGDLVGDDIKDK